MIVVMYVFVYERIAEKCESTPSDAQRATEALAAIPGRFDRLLACAQLYHTRSTRGPIAETIHGARTTVSV